jgi:hypothetical protein
MSVATNIGIVVVGLLLLGALYVPLILGAVAEKREKRRVLAQGGVHKQQ